MKPAVLVARACCGCSLLLSCGLACGNSFTVVPDTSSPSISSWSWKIGVDGGGSTENPMLEVLTGSTYTFAVTTSSIHPFWIDRAPGLGGSLGTDPYPTGSSLSANGLTASATITMNLPADAPDTLYYACGNHASMAGAILVVHDLVFRSNFD